MFLDSFLVNVNVCALFTLLGRNTLFSQLISHINSLNMSHLHLMHSQYTVADLRGCARDAPGVQILSISCRFWEILAKLYVGAPLEGWHAYLGEILDPPLTHIYSVADPGFPRGAPTPEWVRQSITL